MPQSLFLIYLIVAFFLGIGVACAYLLPRLNSKKRLLLKDQLLDLPNFNGFLDFLKRNQKANTHWALFLIDLNDFRRFNRMGYDVGDKVLLYFASKLKASLAKHAFCARYRLGDEFLIVVPLQDAETIEGLLILLNRELGSLPDDEIMLRDPIHFTYGMAAIDKMDTTGENAINVAHGILMEKK